MGNNLTRSQVEQLLDAVLAELPHKGCRSCECLQGFLAQLEVDADPEAGDLLGTYRLPADEIHACLGCDPCVAAETLDLYMRHDTQE